MVRIAVSDAASSDMQGILSRLAEKAGVSIARRFANEFDALFDRLSEFPGIGAPRSRLGAATRICIVSPYIVVYDYARDRVTIVRVLHGRRKITKKIVQSRPR